MYGWTLLRDLMWKKQDLTTAETCCSMDSSASKVTPSVFTTLENGMDASPTERQSTGTVSLLDDGPQRSTSVFCSLSFNLFFVIHIFICRQHDSTFLNAESIALEQSFVLSPCAALIPLSLRLLPSPLRILVKQSRLRHR